MPDLNSDGYWKSAASVITIVLLVLVVYSRALSCGYIWDDDKYIIENKSLRTTAGLVRIWIDQTATPQYYPLTHTTFWVEYQLWGLDPAGYHATNVLLHAANAVLVWIILCRLKVPGALLASLVFGCHPVHVESVAWVTERKNVLSALLMLSSLLAYLEIAGLRDDVSTPRRGWTRYMIAFVLFVAALLSKTVVCSLPAVILLLIWWKRGRITPRAIFLLVPFFAVGLALALNTAWMERTQVGARGAEFDWSFTERCLIAGRAVWFYAWKLLWPHPLIFMYPRWDLNVNSLAWVYPLGLLAVAAFALIWNWRGHRAFFTAMSYFCGTLFPALGFVNVFPMRYSFVADHFQYLASLGPIVIACAVVDRWTHITSIQKRDSAQATGWNWAHAIAGLWVVLLSVLTVIQIADYRNEEALWTATVQKNPDCWVAYDNLGKIYVSQKKFDRAKTNYLESLRLYPNHAQTMGNVGILLLQQGAQDEAIRYFTDAARQNPQIALPHANLGVIRMRQGKLDEALDHLTEAVRLDPNVPQFRINLGLVLKRKGKLEDALTQFTDAVRLDPISAQAHAVRAELLISMGDIKAALQAYNQMLALQPNDADSRYNVALSLLKQRQWTEALHYCKEALRLRPNDPRFLIQVGYILHELGEISGAQAAYQRASQISPGWQRDAGLSAWRMATDSESSRRDGPFSLFLAKAACQATDNRDVRLLDIQAAALAEVGNWKEAISLARQALRQANPQTDADLVRQFELHLRQYESNQPWRERDPSAK